MLNMLTPVDSVAPALLITRSWLDHIDNELSESAEKVRMYREYYDGEHMTQLTERMRAYMQLKPHQEFSINFMPLVVDGLANRLFVTGFNTVPAQAKLFWEWWKRNRMDARHVDTHTMAIRDGESFVLVEWDSTRGIPVYSIQGAYDGRDGCNFFWSPGSAAPTMAVKRWFEEGPGYKRRMNIYFPDRVMKLVSDQTENDSGWRAIGEAPWVDRLGRPIGIPLVPFMNRPRGYNKGISELDSAIPIQNGANKAVIDMLAAADTDGFRLLTMTGDNPGDLDVAPGTIIYTTKPVGEASISFVPGSDLRPQVEHTMTWIKMIAMVTETPLHYFQISGQAPAADAQQQHEARIIAKAKRASLDFGNSWEEVMILSRRLSNIFGGTNLDEGEIVDTMWDDFEVRAKEDRALSRAKIVQTLTQSGSTLEGALRVAGYSDKEISEMVNMALDTLEP